MELAQSLQPSYWQKNSSKILPENYKIMWVVSISFIPGPAVDIEMNMSEFNFINDPNKQVI